MLETEASRERWTVKLALLALIISVGALLVTVLQLRSSDRAVQVAEHARQDAVAEAERQRIDAKNTLDEQRKDAAAALEAQTKRADRANTLSDRSAKAAEETAKTAAQQFELGDRSWVKVMEVKNFGDDLSYKALRFDDISKRADTGEQIVPGLTYRVHFGYEVHLKILGRSPALNIEVLPELYLELRDSKDHTAEVADEENRVCDDFAKRKKELKNAGTAAFPDETPIVYQGATANVIELTNARSVDIALYLIGCVDYQFQSSDRHHQTRFVYHITHRQSIGGSIFYFTVGKDVAVDDLDLIRIESDDYAY